MFVNLPTDFGKSLIFQSLPIVADIVFGKPRGSSVIVVISPLWSLMEDRVQNLNSICIPAIAITDVENLEIIQRVKREFSRSIWWFAQVFVVDCSVEGHLQKRKLF